MEEPLEIVDAILGGLSFVDESAYFAEVLWNREIHIRLFVHVGENDHHRCIDVARDIFLAVRENEMELFGQGINLVGAQEWADRFLNNSAETSIEIFSNGEGQLVYFLWMGWKLDSSVFS
jgi:hypothetical protein